MMYKKEEIILEENLNEKEIVAPKSSKKIKYTIAIIASTLILAATVTLLVGHFKFNWFQSENYILDVNISRKIYQANYFSEKKTANTRITLTDDRIEERTYEVDSNFVVYIRDKEKVENGYLNTASLIILDSIISSNEVKKDLAHFNIFDEKVIKEFENNPDGSKYPIAIFKFYEDGTIKDIKLPNNMDEYNANTIIELIESVIPKLSRNRKEDMSNGLEIDVKKDQKKTIIVEKSKKKYYTTTLRYNPNSNYYVHPIASYSFYNYTPKNSPQHCRTTIEDGQIKNIETSSSLYLKSEPKKDEINFGPKDFTFDIKSEITSNEIKYEQKDSIELIQKLTKNYKLIDYKELFESFIEKKEEEKEEEINQPTRNLGFQVSASKTFNLASFNFLGQTISVKYEVKMTTSSVSNKIIVSSGLGSFSFGNGGVSASVSNSKTYSVTIFKFVFPNFPAVSVGCLASGTISWGIGVESGSGTSTKYYAQLSGKLTLGAEIKAGWDAIASLSAGAEGTVVSASGKVTISNGSVAKGSGFSLSFGGLSAYIKGCLFTAKIDIARVTIFSGWKSA